MNIRIFYLTLLMSVSLSAPAFAKNTLEELMALDIEALAKVVVTSPTKREQPVEDVPATVIVYDQADFKKYGFRDIKDVLKHTPGVEYGYPHSWLQGGQRGFSGSFAQTKILVDGREDNLVFSGEAYFSHQYPLHNIKRIEVVHGPASALYGADAFVGLINIVTKNTSNTEETTILSAEAGHISQGIDSLRYTAHTIKKFGKLGIAASAAWFYQRLSE